MEDDESLISPGPAEGASRSPFDQRYQVVRRLAIGGMAEVMLARPLPAIGQEPVVIKRILPQLAAQPEFVDMFLAEARVARLLHHPNIVRTYEFGTAEGAYFIAMEFLDGITAHELAQASLRRGDHVPYAHAIAIVREVCAGLHYAHELKDAAGTPLQLVHRDVGPQNVVVTRQGEVKLLDFGIAKSLAASTQTGEGKLKGKLHYLSPEQCRGQCDRRSDVFAAGLLLYELTLGRRAYQAATEDEVVSRVAMGKIDRPRAVCETYPAGLEDVVCRALARSPDKRFPTAEALLQELDRVAEQYSFHSSARARAAIVADVQAEARVIAEVTSMSPPMLELSVDGVIEVDYDGETTDVDAPLARSRRGAATQMPDLPPAQERPLSFIEEEVWRATQVMSGERATNFGFIRLGMRMSGPLDVAALERAIALVDERHDIWRTRYVWRQSVPMAVIEPSVPSTLRVVACDSEAAAEEELARDCAMGFELARAPLHRYLLMKLGPESHLFYHLAHHTVADGYAHVLLSRELGAHYEAFHAGTTPTYPLPSLQYSEVAIRERAWCTAAVRAEHERFWQQHLVDTIPSRPLAHMAERPVGQRLFRAARHLSTISIGRSLGAFCREREVTMPAVLLSALEGLLYGEGTNAMPIAILSVNRPRETMRTLGNFTKFFPLRLRVDGERPFAELLQRTHVCLAECVRFQALPPRFVPSEGRVPYRVFFNFYSASQPMQLPGVEVSIVRIFEKSHVVFDLEVNLIKGRGDVLHMMIDYNSELISEELVGRFAAGYETLLRSVIADPDRKLDDHLRP